MLYVIVYRFGQLKWRQYMIEVHAYPTLKGNWFVNGVINHRVYSDTYRNCSKNEAIKQFKTDARKAYKRYINNQLIK